MALSLKVLGEFAFCDGEGKEISLPTRKTRALLGYLALNADKPQRRERLISLLWSDRGEKQARQSLNQALRSIRKLGSADTKLIVSDGERVTLSGAALETDIGRFRLLLYDNPEAAADLYVGDFLDGLWVADPAFEAWLAATRSELQAHACAALQRAATAAAETGELKRAVAHATRLVGLSPLREDAHRLLMRLLYESGNRAAALLQYRTCAELLEKELQIAPEAATQALFDKIRRNSVASVPAELMPAPLKTSPPLSDKPSIAVLRFANLSGDPDQELLADGMAEDIISGLSHIRWLVVIARSSTFAYKGQSPDVRQIGRDLGVRYVLEGSVRKGGDQIRVSAQLIDTDTGSHVWAETFDREFKAIFDIQDEITDAIVGAIGPQIDRTERVRIKRKPPENVDAWSQYQLALIAYHTGTLESLKAAIEMFDRAAEMDPGFASAYAMGGACRNRLVINHGMENSKSVLEEADEDFRRRSTSIRRMLHADAFTECGLRFMENTILPWIPSRKRLN